MKKITIEMKLDDEDLYNRYLPYFQSFNKGLHSIGIIPTVTVKDDMEILKDKLKAINLLNKALEARCKETNFIEFKQWYEEEYIQRYNRIMEGI